MTIQRDCHLSEGLTQRDQILSWLQGAGHGAREKQLRRALRNWNGDYDACSHGAAAFELLFVHLARAMVSVTRRAAYEAAWGTRALIWADVMAAPAETRADALGRAVVHAARDFSKAYEWGARHRLRLAHPFGMIPLLGRRYRLADIPVSGTSETLMKTAHGLTNKRHHARYGSVARHISDMSDPDANHFALLGGQDGWFGSTNFADQMTLWRRGKYVRLPLTPAAVRKRFTHLTVLAP
jgi:penicillin amidase